MIKKLISSYLIKRGFSNIVRNIQQGLNNKQLTAEETIDLLFSKDYELIRPWQFKEELQQLAQAIGERKPKVVMEIGTANGGTLFMASRMAAPDALIISVDLPGGKFGGGYPEWKVPIYKSFAQRGQRVELVRADSHLDSTFAKVNEILGDRQIDYLFIDGDHTYEGVKHDFELYSKLVKKGGMIGFHDIVIHKGSKCNVFEFWNEIKQQYPYKEFVNNWDQNKFGVGIIEYGKA